MPNELKPTLTNLEETLLRIRSDLDYLSWCENYEGKPEILRDFGDPPDETSLVIDGGPFCGSYDAAAEQDNKSKAETIRRARFRTDQCLLAVRGLNAARGDIELPAAPAESYSGWLPSPVDVRDYKATGPVEDIGTDFGKMFDRIGEIVNFDGDLPSKSNFEDLLCYFTPVEDQGALGTCTAQAGVAVIEYLLNVAEVTDYEAPTRMSCLALFKKARERAHVTWNHGVDLRSTLAAMIHDGVPPDKVWPYFEEYLEAPPNQEAADALSYFSGVTRYFRVDEPGLTGDALKDRIRKLLAAGIPLMFGFSVYRSAIDPVQRDGTYHNPIENEKKIGGHAVVAIGYDDNHEVVPPDGRAVTKGAFRIRNSYGKKYSDDGLGWLPYGYLERGEAVEWFAVLGHEWIDRIAEVCKWSSTFGFKKDPGT